MTDSPPPLVPETGSQLPDGPRALTPAALRALAEAEERRKKAAFASQAAPAETGGRGGLDPIRYGDWEKAGLASDF